MTNEQLKQKGMDIVDRLAPLNQDLQEALRMQDKCGDNDESYSWWCSEECDLRKTITELDKALEVVNDQIDWS